jgi:hypothetical protein
MSIYNGANSYEKIDLTKQLPLFGDGIMYDALYSKFAGIVEIITQRVKKN